jgi:NAD(P)-dependent dehydrogenase (short-subunit alcohol dehydrogenase family)
MGDGKSRYIDEVSAGLPLRRFGKAEEVGAAVVFLMVNPWMNGAKLNADGGSRLV